MRKPSILEQRDRLVVQAQQISATACKTRDQADFMEFELGREIIAGALRLAADQFDKAAEICRREATALTVAMVEEG